MAAPLASHLLYPLQQNKIGFPGWPEPNLDWDSGFGGSVQKKGACTSPLFHFPRWLEVRFPRVSLYFCSEAQGFRPAPVLVQAQAPNPKSHDSPGHERWRRPTVPGA